MPLISLPNFIFPRPKPWINDSKIVNQHYIGRLSVWSASLIGEDSLVEGKPQSLFLLLQ